MSAPKFQIASKFNKMQRHNAPSAEELIKVLQEIRDEIESVPEASGHISQEDAKGLDDTLNKVAQIIEDTLDF